MSKVGKKPIVIPEGVTVKLEGETLEVKGKEGVLIVSLLSNTKVEVKEKEIEVTATATTKQAKANWGTMRSLIQNAVSGVNEGFTKELEIQGVGYRAAMEGNTLVLNVGFSHQVKYPAPDNIKIVVEKNNIKVSGFDKHLVGQVASQIRKVKKPEPYKGKGIRYKDEVVVRKEGKKAGTAAA
ncbi:50S ribosomal protein L6 [Candidatus Wolfebacteria bacterium]|nr:50S ribosomal protein L6 [Candidatus Wolfebacteria bacterium]